MTTNRNVASRSSAAVAVAQEAPRTDDGSAIVEFLGVTLVLLVPVVYLVLVLAQLQGAAFAVDGAAREAARAYVTSSTDEAEGRALAAAGLALQDQGVDADESSLTLTCDGRCDGPDGVVTAHVEADVRLVGVPAFVDALTVPVSASASMPTERFVVRDGP
ncbi:pilus assembly protein [Cellulomonas sp. APG4]|uniref:pilus assembly protein n=1 Tax=Cellulomonas sp. APG4 TaxID=1538656 RepID=UPI001379B954|nr:pilus assembly protein [Cellulomonas sp. APG4]NCT91581.1 pilus assembly protein [Cellulomonas sp. APG4]